jgi:branched-chain amino acid transport system ATP-binding protein
LRHISEGGGTLLKIDNIHTSYGVIEALKGVSLKVKEGEVACLLGANGAGKSTTLLTICGINKPTKGGITFFSRTINGLLPHKIVEEGISLVPEGRRVFPRLTVYENLQMGAFVRSDKMGIEEDMEGIYKNFPILKERNKQLAGTLSGGEQQMLAIARALMSRPRLLLLDEPSLGLAPIMVEKIFKIIKEINKNGTTILLVEQNAALALEIADYGYVMETGRIVMEDKAEKLLKNKKIKEVYLGG